MALFVIIGRLFGSDDATLTPVVAVGRVSSGQPSEGSAGPTRRVFEFDALRTDPWAGCRADAGHASYRVANDLHFGRVGDIVNSN